MYASASNMKRDVPEFGCHALCSRPLSNSCPLGGDDANGSLGPSQAGQAIAGGQDEPKPKASRSVKTPLQKEALEAAYNSEFVSIRYLLSHIPHLPFSVDSICYIALPQGLLCLSAADRMCDKCSQSITQ